MVSESMGASPKPVVSRFQVPPPAVEEYTPESVPMKIIWLLPGFTTMVFTGVSGMPVDPLPSMLEGSAGVRLPDGIEFGQPSDEVREFGCTAFMAYFF